MKKIKTVFLTVAIFTIVSAALAQEVTMAKVEYKGWKNNIKLSNAQVELVITLDVGPRVISFAPKGGANVFKEYGDHLGKGGEKEWMIRGGHRFWIAPENKEITYYPDNAPVANSPLGKNGVRVTPPPEQSIGFQKEMDITLDDARFPGRGFRRP